MYSSNFIDRLHAGVTLAVTRYTFTRHEVARHTFTRFAVNRHEVILYTDVRLSYIKRFHEK